MHYRFRGPIMTGAWVVEGILIKRHAASPSGSPPGGAGCVMTSTAGPVGRLCSCSAPLVATLRQHHVCLGKISNVKPLQHPEHAAKGRHDGEDRKERKKEWMDQETIYNVYYPQ